MTGHTLLRSCRDVESHTEKLTACGRNTSMPIDIANGNSETTSSGCAISNPAISRGTSTYSTTSALALPTPTMSGAEFLNELFCRARQQAVVERRAHYRICRASVDERIANQQSADHCTREQQGDASSSRRPGASRLRLRLCGLCILLITTRRTVTTELSGATIRVATAWRFSFKCARRRDVAGFATLETDYRVR